MLFHFFIPNRSFMVSSVIWRASLVQMRFAEAWYAITEAHQKGTIRIYHTLNQARIWSYPISDLISHNIKTDDKAYHRLIRNLGAIAIQRRRPGIVTSIWQETRSNSWRFKWECQECRWPRLEYIVYTFFIAESNKIVSNMS